MPNHSVTRRLRAYGMRGGDNLLLRGMRHSPVTRETYRKTRMIRRRPPGQRAQSSAAVWTKCLPDAVPRNQKTASRETAASPRQQSSRLWLEEEAQNYAVSSSVEGPIHAAAT